MLDESCLELKIKSNRNGNNFFYYYFGEWSARGATKCRGRCH